MRILCLHVVIALISLLQPACATAADQEPPLEKRGSLIILAPPSRDVWEVRVQSLAVEAAVANWDQDAEWDGIELRVLPRAADGIILPVTGTVAVDLIGRLHFPERTTRGFPKLGTWSQAVRAHDFGSRGSIYHLPFPGTDLGTNLQLQSWGRLEVTLQVPRQGVFQATTPVRLRTFDPVRDAWYEHQRHYDSFGRYRARHW